MALKQDITKINETMMALSAWCACIIRTGRSGYRIVIPR